MIKKKQNEWRYVLIKVIDRISIIQLNPTLLYFIEKIYPENSTMDSIIE